MPDFEGLAAYLLTRIRDIIPTLVPGGKIQGSEYVAGDIHGSHGKSFKINLDTGLWSDFSQGQSGGDVISLYAAIHNLKQSEAAEQLSQQYNFGSTPAMTVPSMRHPVYGAPAQTWAYRDGNGTVLHYTARYNTKDGKEFMPWTWVGNRWQAKAYPEPRPLYGLETLSKPAVLIVEGEKAADAARQLLGDSYSVVSWSGGSKAFRKADWAPVYGKRVLIWPDADEPGVSAAKGIAQILASHCPEVKIITPDPTRPKAWDAWDALNDGWTREQVIDWARANVTIFQLNVTNNITVQVDEPPSEPTESNIVLWERLGLALTGQGNIICNEQNIVRIFEREPHLSKRCWIDDFHDQIFTQDGTQSRYWTEIDTLKMMYVLQEKYGMSRVSDAQVWRAVRIIADREHRNEPKDWMESLEWDGTPRIADFMTTHLGAKPSEYARAASKNFWVSMAARIYQPGCIMRSMVILKSKQLTGKSTAFSIIGGKWYSEALENIQSNNFLQSLHGNLLIEFGDLAGMDRAEVNRIKQIISCRKDRFRAPYERNPRDHLRQSVLVGTTNEEQFLRDHTGGTRFWPIETGEINHKAIEADRDQLFAEAVARFKAGENWHIMPTEETNSVQDFYRQQDVWFDKIVEKLDQLPPNEDEIQIIKIATDFLGIPIGNVKKTDEIRIGNVLVGLGWTRFKKRSGTQTLWFWRKPENVPFSDTEQNFS